MVITAFWYTYVDFFQNIESVLEKIFKCKCWESLIYTDFTDEKLESKHEIKQLNTQKSLFSWSLILFSYLCLTPWFSIIWKHFLNVEKISTYFGLDFYILIFCITSPKPLFMMKHWFKLLHDGGNCQLVLLGKGLGPHWGSSCGKNGQSRSKSYNCGSLIWGKLRRSLKRSQ